MYGEVSYGAARETVEEQGGKIMSKKGHEKIDDDDAQHVSVPSVCEENLLDLLTVSLEDCMYDQCVTSRACSRNNYHKITNSTALRLNN